MNRLVVIPRVLSKFRIGGDLYIPALLKFQRKINKEIIQNYRNIHSDNAMNSDYVIWTCWWQGKNSMPDVIQKCHESLLRNCNGHKVVLITKDNYSEYVTIPEEIVSKMESGIISLSHFSDIIRLSLLSQYGGMWVDSALFILKPLQTRTSFFMPKMAKKDSSICQGKWWFGVMAGPAGHKLFRYMLDSLLSYWKNHDAVINYLMFDGFLRIACEEYDDINRTIDNLEVSSPDLHSSRYTFGDEVDIKHFDYVVKHNDFLSLTWRIEYPSVTENGTQTYYGKLLEFAELS